MVPSQYNGFNLRTNFNFIIFTEDAMKESYQTRQGALILEYLKTLAGPVTAESLCAAATSATCPTSRISRA